MAFVDHTCVRVKNLEASITFYQDAFGFEEVERRDFPDNEFTLCYLSLPGQDYKLELTYNYDHEAYDLGDGYGHIAIVTADAQGLHQAHKEAGYPVTDYVGLPGTEPFYYFVTDPDGYKIEVIDEEAWK